MQRECLCFYVDFSENISSLVIIYHRIFLFKVLFSLTRFSLFWPAPQRDIQSSSPVI